MKAMLAVLALAAAPAAAPNASRAAPPARVESGWVIREEVRLPDGRTGWQRTEIAFGRIRRTTSRSPEVLLVDPSSATPVVRVFPDRKSWSGVARELFDGGNTPGPFLEGVGISDGDALDAPAKPFRATGESQPVGAWQAREHVSVAKAPGSMETRLWLAESPGGLANDALLSIAERVYARKGNRWEKYFRGMKELGGFPVRTVYRYATGAHRAAEVVVTVTHIEQAALEEAAFLVPAGFERIAETRLPEPDPEGRP